MATQGERREQTRAALLQAGARLFAERGVADSSVDAIAAAAGRTSGALYDHFGSKEGLLFALLEGWVDDVAAVMSAELLHSHSLTERMAALWRNLSDPAVGGGRWLDLEHELWSYAMRNEAARARLVERYRFAWRGLDLLSDAGADGVEPSEGWELEVEDRSEAVGAAVLGTALGLEMMRRADPSVVNDEIAVAALCGVVTATAHHRLDAGAPSAHDRSITGAPS
jgi:AcrR family transcriptional regulator